MGSDTAGPPAAPRPHEGRSDESERSQAPETGVTDGPGRQALQVRIAAVQMSSQGDVQANLDAALTAIARAASGGAKVVVLPENFAFLGDEDTKCALAEDLRPGAPLGPIGRALSAAAEGHGLVIIAGGMPERSEDPSRPYNTCAVFGPDGAVAGKYRKIHLFDVTLNERRYHESARTMPGDAPLVVEVARIRVGLSVCYDLRFPELYRALSDDGAEVIVVPAAFTVTTGKDHWHVLLRARAIEAQAYVVAAAQWGTHPRGRVTYGKSCIIDPWGDVIAQAPEGESVVIAEFDRSYLGKVRRELPALAHRSKAFSQAEGDAPQEPQSGRPTG